MVVAIIRTGMSRWRLFSAQVERALLKLDPFMLHLQKRIDDGVFNCNKLLTEIQKQGYQGGKSLVKNFVQPYRTAQKAQATVRYETEPGDQAQVDWGHFGLIEHHGRQHRLYAFVMTKVRLGSCAT